MYNVHFLQVIDFFTKSNFNLTRTYAFVFSHIYPYAHLMACNKGSSMIGYLTSIYKRICDLGAI